MVYIKIFLISKLFHTQKGGKILLWNQVKSRMETCYSELVLIFQTRSQTEGISSHRKLNPFKSKMLLASYALLSCIMRVTAVIMYFAPTLGLLNLLRHLQGSQYISSQLNYQPQKFDKVSQKLFHIILSTVKEKMGNLDYFLCLSQKT